MQFGVDEAGKGPVLGSMFSAVVRAPVEALPDGVDDSKRLSAKRREELAVRLRSDDRIAVATAEIKPSEIDAGNMNELTVAAHAEAIRSVAAPGDFGVCDAADVNAERFATRVAERIDPTITVDAIHRADASNELVGAASIVAKSERESHVEMLGERLGEIGSGYPSDPTTRRFLRQYLDEHGEFPPQTRLSWSTCASIRAELEQSGIDEF